MNILQALADKYDGVATGYVYLMEYKFTTKLGNEKILYKIGVTINAPIDRMLQISRSFFQLRRYVPESRLVRFRKVPNYYELEKILHKKLDNYRFSFKDKFDGSTEFFDIDKELVIEEYEKEVPLLKKK